MLGYIGQNERQIASANTQLVCFDFDKTIVTGHFHNFLMNKDVKEGNGAKFVDDFFSIYDFRNAYKTLTAMKRILEAGHVIAITSFTLYPEVIKPSLKKLGLSEDALEKIIVIGGFPTNDGTLDLTGKKGLNLESGKMLHMQQAMRSFGITEKRNVVLVDDTQSNVAKAIADGFVGIIAPDHDHTGEYLKNLCKSINIDSELPEAPANPLAQTMRFQRRGKR